MKYHFEDHCWKDIVSDEILKIYEPYHRETYVGPRPALLAIDLYKSVYAGGNKPVIDLHDEYPGSCGENAWNAIAPTEQLFAACRAAGLPVIYCTRDDMTKMGKGKLSSTNRKRARKAPDAHEIFEAFTPQEEDLIIYKNRASVFFGTPLTAFLTQMGIDSLIVCGESTSGCVRASVVDAYSHGYHVSLVEECCFDRSMLSHKVNLFDLHHKYADVMHIDEVLDHLGELRPTAKSAVA
jgi:nicotinamidase-related amidase